MSRRIGILGGISAQSTLLYYEIIHREHRARYGHLPCPEVVIYSLSLDRFDELEDRLDEEAYVSYLYQGARALEQAGADFLVIACNSAHRVVGRLLERLSIPILSIVAVTSYRAAELGLKRLLLLGGIHTMRSSMYHDACAEYSIRVITPGSKAQEDVDRILRTELVHGIISPSSRLRIKTLIEGYDIDGVILGCTELPLLMRPGDVSIPLLNTAELHSIAALEYAFEALEGESASQENTASSIPQPEATDSYH